MSHSPETKLHKEQIGKNIAVRLRQRDMSQSQLAREYGCSRQYISVIVSRGTVSGHVIDKIAQILKCSSEVLTKVPEK